MPKKNLRAKTYERESRDGVVSCFVCRAHVPWPDATLEHIIARSLGGTNERSNLAISHAACNFSRKDGAHDRRGVPISQGRPTTDWRQQDIRRS
jgi:5-methylcytosine-specific restriction endonuclease McrA